MLFREPERAPLMRRGGESRSAFALRDYGVMKWQVASYVKQVNRLSQDIGDKNAFLQRFCF